MRLAALLLCVAALLSPLAAPAASSAPAGGAARPTRQQLIGAWRLMSIEYKGPNGELPDPFYQPDSMGIIIYDASGWMSVHISAPHRRTWTVPESRSSSAAAGDAQLQAAAFDTYYAYYGTWTYQEAAGTVTHHVKASLIPAESGLDYTQAVTLEGARLVFTTRSHSNGAEITRRKIWERISPN
jgi:Lipocalin-like domain